MPTNFERCATLGGRKQAETALGVYLTTETCVCGPRRMSRKVGKMQTAGFDIQITGYGLSKTYHADNGYALLSEMMDAYQILLLIISSMDSESSGTNSNSGL